MEDGSKLAVDPADFRGPYMYTPDEEFPKDPITKKREWSYDKRSGEVASKARGTTLDGMDYREL